MSEQPTQRSLEDQPLLEYADQLRIEEQADIAPPIELPEHPGVHVDLRATQIDSAYNNAVYAQEWKDRLSNPSIVARLGRRILNSAGVRSPKQKAIAHHEAVIANYTSEIGESGADISVTTPGLHDKKRDHAIAQGIKNGTVTELTYSEAIDRTNPKAAAYRDQAAVRRQKVLEMADYNSSEKLHERIEETIALEKVAARSSGERSGGLDELDVKARMLQESIAADEAILNLLKPKK